MKYRKTNGHAVALSGTGRDDCLRADANPSSSAQPDSVVSRAEFEQIFPNHIGFYSYDGFASAHPLRFPA